MLSVVSCSLGQASVPGGRVISGDRATGDGAFFPECCVCDTLSRARQLSCVLTGCQRLQRASRRHQLRAQTPDASRTSELLSFVLKSIIRIRRAPCEKHWLAAIRTGRLIVHAKVSRIPQLVPHKPRPPEPDLKNSATKRGKCVDSRTKQCRRSRAMR